VFEEPAVLGLPCEGLPEAGGLPELGLLGAPELLEGLLAVEPEEPELEELELEELELDELELELDELELDELELDEELDDVVSQPAKNSDRQRILSENSFVGVDSLSICSRHPHYLSFSFLYFIYSFIV
jgi:hypothetical protein